MTPDVNVLLAASRTDHPHHSSLARGWSVPTAAADRAAACLVMPMVIAGFLRLRHEPEDLSGSDTRTPLWRHRLAARRPGVELTTWAGKWPSLRRLVHQHQLAANDVPDAWIAAVGADAWHPARDFEPRLHALAGPQRV